ncbi:MAG: hypothetical protein KDJ37_04400 [Hyphomicrobiaceae bacterium]|nr:hypothetical protein [Hyphomicrobiaceae bacterium]
MDTGNHRLRIEFVDITGMLLRSEDISPFNALVEAAKARVQADGTGTFDFADLGYGGSIQFTCDDADACYQSIADLLAASPLAEGATAELIYGCEDDADRQQIAIGVTA